MAEYLTTYYMLITSGSRYLPTKYLGQGRLVYESHDGLAHTAGRFDLDAAATTNYLTSWDFKREKSRKEG